MAAWYLRKSDGHIYGPTEMDDIAQWAAEGRIEPSDRLSTDRAYWRRAHAVPELNMVYTVVLEDGQTYGPIHLLAVQELLREGSISSSTPVLHNPSQETKDAAAWFASGPHQDPLQQAENQIRALTAELAEARQTEEQIQALSAQLAEARQAEEQVHALTAELFEVRQALAERPEAPPIPPDTPVDNVQEKAAAIPDEMEMDEPAPIRTMLSGDNSVRDAQKWRNLFEQEQAERKEIESSWLEQKRALRDHLHQVQSENEHLQAQVRELERRCDASQTEEGADPDRASDVALYVAYEKLTANYQQLLAQVQEQSEELENARQQHTHEMQEAEERYRNMESIVQTEREKSGTTQRRLTELESAHMQLLKSFRDLNDRYIRLRQEKPFQPSPDHAVE